MLQNYVLLICMLQVCNANNSDTDKEFHRIHSVASASFNKPPLTPAQYYRAKKLWSVVITPPPLSKPTDDAPALSPLAALSTENVSPLILATKQGHNVSRRADAHSDVPPPVTVHVAARDCRHSSHLRTYEYSDVCETKGPDYIHNSDEHIMILQHANTYTVKALRCKREVSRFDSICGAYSHTKLMEAPSVLEPEVVPVSVCGGIHATHSFQDETGHVHPVKLDQTTFHYKYLSSGELSYSKNNVFCEGSQLKVAGKVHDDVVEMVTVKFSVTTVDLIVNPTEHTVKDSDSNRFLPYSCSDASECQSSDFTYIIEKSTSKCSLKLVKTSPVSYVTVNIDGKRQEAIYSNRSRLFVPLNGAAPIPPYCRDTVTSLLKTEFPNVYVVPTSAILQTPQQVTGEDVDLNLEERLIDTYLIYQIKLEVRENFRRLGTSLCSLTSDSWSRSQISPFHPNHLLRNRGDILQEYSCKAVTVTLVTGENNQKCYHRALPVRLGSSHMLLDVDTKEVISISPLMETDCENQAGLVVKSTEGFYITASPDVKILQFNFSHASTPLLHSLASDLTEVDSVDIFSEALFYSAEEIKAYESLVHQERARSAINSRISTAYCSGNDDCGDFAPSASLPFDISQLNPIPNPLQVLSNIWEHAQSVGAAFGLCMLCYHLVRLTATFYNLCALRCSGYSWSDSRRIIAEPRQYRLEDRPPPVSARDAVELVPLQSHQPLLQSPAPLPARAPPKYLSPEFQHFNSQQN